MNTTSDKKKESKWDLNDVPKKSSDKEKINKWDLNDRPKKDSDKEKENKWDLSNMPNKSSIKENEGKTDLIDIQNEKNVSDSEIKIQVNSEQIENFEDKNDSISDFPKEECSTLELIEGLKEKLQERSEELAQIFPERLNKYSQAQLSRFWRNTEGFIHKVTYLYKKEGHYNIRDSTVDLLKQNLLQQFDEQKSTGSLQIIERFNQDKINILTMTEQLRLELGKISGEIPVTNQELSHLFGGYSGYIKEVLQRITNIDKRDYNPDFKFSIEQLEDLSNNLGIILKDNSEECLEIIGKYKEANQDLKEYSHEQTTIKNKHAFAEISDIKTSYWFGFMCADAHVNHENYEINFRLKTSDRERVEKFADFIGYDLNRIHDSIEYYRYKGEIRQTEMSSVHFVSKIMARELYDNGFFSQSSEERKLPETILSEIKEADSISNNGPETNSGAIPLSFLLGYYDGDGNYRGGRSARIYSSSKEILEEIKIAYKIKNNVNPLRPKLEADEIIEDSKYYITPGPKLLEQMLKTYKDSMQRKRIPDKLLNRVH